MPSEDRVRVDNARDRCQQVATKSLALGGEPATLVVGEPQPLAAKLFLQHAVLLAQVVDDLRLLAVDEAGEHGEEEVQRGQWVRHRAEDGSSQAAQAHTIAV